MIEEMKGVPVYELGRREYLGNYIKHTSRNEVLNGVKRTVVEITLGFYELYCKTTDNIIYPIYINGVPTIYLELIKNGVIIPNYYFKREVPYATISAYSDCFLNLEEVVEGKDPILFIDTQKIIEDYVEFKHLPKISYLKEMIEKSDRTIKKLDATISDYKKVVENLEQENRHLEFVLSNYRTMYHNMRQLYVVMEHEIDKLNLEIKRIVKQYNVSKEIQDKLESMLLSVISYISELKRRVDEVNINEKANEND